jgi:hypothetical protein
MPSNLDGLTGRERGMCAVALSDGRLRSGRSGRRFAVIRKVRNDDQAQQKKQNPDNPPFEHAWRKHRVDPFRQKMGLSLRFPCCSLFMPGASLVLWARA